MCFFVNRILLWVTLHASLVLVASCSHAPEYELIQYDEFDGWGVSIQAKKRWEYVRPFYYSISHNDQLLVGPTFIELDQADRIEAKFSDGLIYGVSGTVNDVVFFVYRIEDGAHWPGSCRENKDILMKELRARTGKEQLKPINDVSGHYLGREL